MLRQIGLALLSGTLYALSFPPHNLSAIAWICLVPLLLVVESPRSLAHARHGRRSFSLGWLAGFAANLGIFFWLWDTFQAAQIGVITTIGCWLALALILGAYFGAMTWCLGFISNPWAKPWLAGAFWVVLESIRSVILTGFPWALWSHTQVHNLALIQLAAFTGAPGISFLLMAVNTAIAHTIRTKWAGWRPALAVFAITSATLVGGTVRLSRPPADRPQKEVKVAVLQGNIDQYKKWNAAYEAEVRERYESLAIQAAATQPDVIIWPESAVPGWFPNEPFYDKWVRDLVRKTNRFHIIGSCTSSTEMKAFNAGFFLDPQGMVVALYAKRKLVPFGEYIPFGGFFKAWIPYLGELGTFSAGQAPTLFTTEINYSPNICYEAIFPRILRNSEKIGADIFVNLTNDGWFLQTGAPEQHFNANILRAVEFARPVVRVANTGISGVIDAYGRIMMKTPLMKTGAHVVDIPIYGNGRTVYARMGEWFLFTCWLVVIAFWVAAFARKANVFSSTPHTKNPL